MTRTQPTNGDETMRSDLESMTHGSVKCIGTCVVTRLGEWYYSSGESVNVLTNTPRTIWGMIEFISDHGVSHP